MNKTTLFLGLAACGYGFYTAWARRAHPGQFGKLEAMKKQFGERNGNALHLFSYTILPLLLGLGLMVAGLRAGE